MQVNQVKYLWSQNAHKTNQDSKLRYPQWWQVAWICVFVYVFFSIFSNGMFTSPLKVFSDGAWALFLTIKELLSSKWTRGESKHLVFGVSSVDIPPGKDRWLATQLASGKWRFVVYRLGMPYFPKSGDSWIYPYPNVGPLWEIPIDGFLWVLSSPRIPGEHQLNTMGILLGVHPNCRLRSSKSITKWFLWNPKRTNKYDAPDSLCLITYTDTYISYIAIIMLLIKFCHFLIILIPTKKGTHSKACLWKKKSCSKPVKFVSAYPFSKRSPKPPGLCCVGSWTVADWVAARGLGTCTTRLADWKRWSRRGWLELDIMGENEEKPQKADDDFWWLWNMWFSQQIPLGSMGLVYLPTFTIKTNQMWVNIPVPSILWDCVWYVYS